MSARFLGLRWQTVLKLVLIILLIVAANFIAGEIAGILSLEIRPSNEDLVHRIVMVSAAGYAMLIAVPFVPGVEVGFAIIGVHGPQIVPLIYLCTIAGLMAGFLLGRLISLRSLSKLLKDVGLNRASKLLHNMEPMDRETRLMFLVQKAPIRIVPFLLRHRYIALAVALNLPGNFIIGGGGGIAMMAGVSGLYSPVGYIATIAIAVSPVPIVILTLGEGILSH